MDIREKLKSGEYENPLPYSEGDTKAERELCRKRYQGENWKIQDQFKRDLLADIFGDDLPRIPLKAQEIFWRIVWSEGHSSGYEEVINYAENYSDLVRAMLEVSQ